MKPDAHATLLTIHVTRLWLPPCAQALQVFLEQEGELQHSAAWLKLQPVHQGLVGNTAKLWRQMVRGCAIKCKTKLGGSLAERPSAHVRHLSMTLCTC